MPQSTAITIVYLLHLSDIFVSSSKFLSFGKTFIRILVGLFSGEIHKRKVR